MSRRTSTSHGTGGSDAVPHAGRLFASAGESPRRTELRDLAATMFAQHGYSATTIRGIANAANILSGSLYHHFDSKESIVDEILRVFLDEIMATYNAVLKHEPNPAQQLEDLIRASFTSVDRHQPAIAIYQNDGASLARKPRFAYLLEASDQIEQIWIGVLSRGAKAGTFRSRIDPRLVYRYIRDSVWVAARWYRPDGALTLDAMADQYISLVLTGLLASKTKHTTAG